MSEQSDFEFISEILLKSAPMTAKEIAKVARSGGRNWQRTEANSSLYRMLKRGLVQKLEVEGVVAPLWTVPNSEHKDQVLTQTIKSESRKPRQKPLDPVNLPLQSDPKLSVSIQGVEIQFSIDDAMSEHDPYMHGDWLNDKVFVSLNPNHPFWTSFVINEDRKALFTTLIAEEVYVQWQVARRESQITPSILHAIRDKAMRDISIHSRASRSANED
jgi:hypothetical protein